MIASLKESSCFTPEALVTLAAIAENVEASRAWSVEEAFRSIHGILAKEHL